MSQSPMQKLFTENGPKSDAILEQVIHFGGDYLGGEWKNVKKEQVNVRQIVGGQSNHLFHVTSSTSATPFLIRIHRQPPLQVFIDTVNFSIFSERGLGPKLYGFFDGGRLEEYLPSKTMTLDDVLNPEISRRIGAVFPKYHASQMPISKTRSAISLMREWLDGYKQLGGGDYTIRPRTVTYSDHPKTVSIDDLARELDTFEKWASIFEDTVVYSHNDLACGNILELDSTEEIVLIDWEFGTYNWRGFDLAMHLTQTTVNFRVPFPPGVKFIEELIDNPPNIRNVCEAYVDADNKLKNRTPSDRSAEIARLIHECEFFWPLANLFFGIYSLRKLQENYDCGVDLDVSSSDRLAIFFHMRPKSQRIYEELFIGSSGRNKSPELEAMICLSRTSRSS